MACQTTQAFHQTKKLLKNPLGHTEKTVSLIQAKELWRYNHFTYA